MLVHPLVAYRGPPYPRGNPSTQSCAIPQTTSTWRILAGQSLVPLGFATGTIGAAHSENSTGDIIHSRSSLLKLKFHIGFQCVLYRSGFYIAVAISTAFSNVSSRSANSRRWMWSLIPQTSLSRSMSSSVAPNWQCSDSLFNNNSHTWMGSTTCDGLLNGSHLLLTGSTAGAIALSCSKMRIETKSMVLSTGLQTQYYTGTTRQVFWNCRTRKPNRTRKHGKCH